MSRIETALPPAQRILLAKVGLDGHDRGIKVVARGLRDAGFHVIYAGIWQSPEAVARAVADEDADWLGLSILSGAHLTLVPRVLEALRAVGADRVRVMVGGIVPDEDVGRLHEMGIAHVFGPGSSIESIADFLRTDQPNGNDVQTPARERGAASADLHADNRAALARGITRVSRGEPWETVRENLPVGDNKSLVVAFTGSGGVGKSTLVGKLIEPVRGLGKTIAVLACDPESPLTGGALLGDRIRMPIDPADAGVFIRSLAAPSGRQSIAENLDKIVALTQACGFEIVLLETAGAGQGDTAVREMADVVVVLLQPEAGDTLQWQKAGLLEIADIVVIHKADLPGAERVEAEVRQQLNPPGCREVPVVRVSAHEPSGLDELWRLIESVSADR